MEKEELKNVYVKPKLTAIHLTVESSLLTASTEKYEVEEW